MAFHILKWYFFLATAFILAINAFKLGPLSSKSNQSHGSGWHGSVDRDTKRNIEKLAIVRPFSTQNIEELSQAFDKWDAFLPCKITKLNTNGRSHVTVDMFLSYSQTFESFKPARDSVLRIINDFSAKHNSSGWERCIESIRSIEAKIDPKVDLYALNESHKNRMWVHGPNQQFVNSMETILGGEFGHYDAVFVMESDVVPVRQYWLDSLLEDAERYPFMILGSKYDGDSWDEFRSSLPISLQHHINGNAVYNATHPLLKKLLNQLQLEEDTPYHAVPYDYRISQILVEGMLGILPDLPPDIVNNWSNNNGLKLKRNTKKFRAWWNKYCSSRGETRNTLIRESDVIANYAGTNLLPRHMESIEASLIHGATHYESWNSFNYEITLVVSEWHDGLASNLLSQIDTSVHPFSKVVLMVPHNMASHDIDRLSRIQSNIEVSIQKRNTDFMDICNAPVNTEYFMITNSYHVVSLQVDLLFTNDGQGLPVIPFTRADQAHCLDFQPCVKAHKVSQQFDKHNTIIVQDFDMLFKSDLRDEYCNVWRQTVKDIEIQDPHEQMRPTATGYTSFLSMQGVLNNFYRFTDRGIFSKRENFRRIISINDESNAVYGETPLSNYIMKEDSLKNDETPLSNYIMEENSVKKRMRFLQRTPSFTPPGTPTGAKPLSPSLDLSRSTNQPMATNVPTRSPISKPHGQLSPIPLTIDLGSPEAAIVAVTDGNNTSSRFPTPDNKASSSKPITFSLGGASHHMILCFFSLVLFV